MMKTIALLCYTQIRSGSFYLFNAAFVTRCIRSYKPAEPEDANFFIIDDEDVARTALTSRDGAVVILITPKEFDSRSEIPGWKVTYPRFCPINPGDVLLHLPGLVRQLVENHFGPQAPCSAE